MPFGRVALYCNPPRSEKTQKEDETKRNDFFNDALRFVTGKRIDTAFFGRRTGVF